MKYQGLWRNVRRATSYWRRSRGFADTSRRRAFLGTKHRRSPGTAMHLIALAAPPFVVSVLGLVSIHSYAGHPLLLSYGWQAFVFFILTFILGARTFAATAPPWMKVVAYAAGALFPLGLLLRAWGLWP